MVDPKALEYFKSLNTPYSFKEAGKGASDINEEPIYVIIDGELKKCVSFYVATQDLQWLQQQIDLSVEALNELHK